MATTSANLSKADYPSSSGDDVREQLAALRSDVSELTSALAGYVKEQKDAMQTRAASGIESVKQAGKAGLKVTGDKAGELKSATEDMVRENPAGAVAVSAGLGFIIGLLMRRA